MGKETKICKTCKWWVVPNTLLGTPNEARVCRSEFVDRGGSNPFSTKIKIQAVTLEGEKIKDYYTVTEADFGCTEHVDVSA